MAILPNNRINLLTLYLEILIRIILHLRPGAFLEVFNKATLPKILDYYLVVIFNRLKSLDFLELKTNNLEDHRYFKIQILNNLQQEDFSNPKVHSSQPKLEDCLAHLNKTNKLKEVYFPTSKRIRIQGDFFLMLKHKIKYQIQEFLHKISLIILNKWFSSRNSRIKLFSILNVII